MPCKNCDKKLPARERKQVGLYELAQQRRTSCSSCDANQDGNCQELGLPVVELTKDWSSQCPRGQFGGVKQSCPGCNRAGQYLSRSSLCRWCEIDRNNRNRKNGRSRSSLLQTSQTITPLLSQPIEPIYPVLCDSGRTTVVWVYWAGGQRANELWYSMKLAQQHLQDVGSMVLCGDVPHWYHGLSIVSPRVSEQEAKSRYGGTRYRKWLDSIVKLQKIIDSPLVTETFLWMYDDTFVVRNASVGEIATPRYSGNLATTGRGSWRTVMKQTASKLQRLGLPTRNYSTHYPIVFSKEKLQRTLDMFNPWESPLLIESTYQNQWAESPKPHAKEFEYVQRVRGGWRPKPGAVIANVGQFNAPAESAIRGIMRSSVKATAT